MLLFLGSVSQFAALVEVDGALEGMVRLAHVQSDLDAPAHVEVRGPVDHEQQAFDAADFPQGVRQLSHPTEAPERSGVGPSGTRLRFQAEPYSAVLRAVSSSASP